MLARRPSQHTVSLILRLRKSAEGDARRCLEASRAQLALAKLREAQAGALLQQAESALAAARVLPKKGPVPAQDVLAREALVRRLHEDRQAQTAALLVARQQVASLAERVEKMRGLLFIAIGQREAAELHRLVDRRERARLRTSREDALTAPVDVARHRTGR